jgi:hypothetical protein
MRRHLQPINLVHAVRCSKHDRLAAIFLTNPSLIVKNKVISFFGNEMTRKFKVFSGYGILCILLFTIGQSVFAVSIKILGSPQGGQPPVCEESYNKISSGPTLELVELALTPLCEHVDGDLVKHRIMLDNEERHVVLSCLSRGDVLFECAYPISEEEILETPQELLESE